MNQQIKITVKGKIASTDFSEVVTFNSVYALKFELDEEWDEFPSRVAVVKWAGGAKEKLFSGTECVMPQIDSEDAEQVLIGVYSIKEDKRLASSFVALRCEPGTGDALQPKPVQTLHDQVLALLNEEHKTLDNPLVIGEKSYNGSESVTVTADDLGLSDVATSGSYNDLTDKPVIDVPVTSVNGKTGEVTVTADDLGLSDVATSGSYNDLTDKPEISEAPVTSVNGKTGDVTVSKYDLSLAEVAISGSYTDLKDKPEIVYPVTSVNGETGEVKVDANSLGLAAVATSGKYTDLQDIPESGVISVNGQTGEVNVTPELLGLGKLAKLNSVDELTIDKDSIMNHHLYIRCVTSEKISGGAIDTRTLADKNVTAIKLADDVLKAGTGASVSRDDDGAYTVGLDTSQVVTSLNGQTGDVTVDPETMGLSQVAFSGKFSDLIDVPESGVVSVNGQAGEVTVDADSLGLAQVAKSGNFSDLIGVPESTVFSVNGQTGEVNITPESLELGKLAKLNSVDELTIDSDSIMNHHLYIRCVTSEKISGGAIDTRTLADKNVTGIKIADEAIKAGDGITVNREEDGNFTVGVQADGFVRSLNGQTGNVEISKESLGLTHVTSERQMPLAADTRKGADFNTLFPNGFYHIEGTESDPCSNNPVSSKNTGYNDCSWFLLVMANNDNSSAVQVAFSARGDFAMRMRGFADGQWSKWSNIPA